MIISINLSTFFFSLSINFVLVFVILLKFLLREHKNINGVDYSNLIKKIYIYAYCTLIFQREMEETGTFFTTVIRTSTEHFAGFRSKPTELTICQITNSCTSPYMTFLRVSFLSMIELEFVMDRQYSVP